MSRAPPHRATARSRLIPGVHPLVQRPSDECLATWQYLGGFVSIRTSKTWNDENKHKKNMPGPFQKVPKWLLKGVNSPSLMGLIGTPLEGCLCKNRFKIETCLNKETVPCQLCEGVLYSWLSGSSLCDRGANWPPPYEYQHSVDTKRFDMFRGIVFATPIRWNGC